MKSDILKRSRQLKKIIRVDGKFVLQTPALFSTGEEGNLMDMEVLRSASDGKPFIPGTSIAGALRYYLHTRLCGYRQDPKKTDPTETLFGERMERNKRNGRQSALIIEDAFLEGNWESEYRDGLSIDPKTRLGIDRQKFDMELIAPGAAFKLGFELYITQNDDEQALVRDLAIALEGFHDGADGIRLGVRKNRGFGAGSVEKWNIMEYNLNNPEGLLAWIKRTPGVSINFSDKITEDKREYFLMTAVMKPDQAVMIHSAYSGDFDGPDKIHIRSKDKPVLPGTALCGVLRHRALRIVNTIGVDRKIIEDIFGSENEQDKNKTNENELRASRLRVSETIIENAIDDLVQNRIKIDRFTGGTYEGALFNDQPIFAKEDTRLTIELFLENPKDEEIGLLLLLLKDLWTSDLPIGGTASVGRGRLQGLHASFKLKKDGQEEKWEIKSEKQNLQVEPIDAIGRMESFVRNLNGTEAAK